mgnify:CR=1 FL=1
MKIDWATMPDKVFSIILCELAIIIGFFIIYLIVATLINAPPAEVVQ